MKRLNEYSLTLICVALAVTACGGGNSSGSSVSTPTATKFDATSVKTAATEVATFVSACQKTGAAAAAAVRKELTTADQLVSMKRSAQAVPRPVQAATYTSTQPADKLGDCGGRITYTSYSHASGVTTATRSFDNYCSSSSNGTKQYINGSMSFVNTATPAASGPITSQFAAQSPNGLTMVAKDSTGKTVTSQTYTFTNYLYKIGVPGATPTSSNPDQVQVERFVSTDNLTGKAYRQDNFNLTSFKTTSGGEQVTIAGRGYRSNGDYYDMNTSTALVTDSSGAYLSGAMTFTGAAGSTVVATVVPGNKFQTTLTVDGTPVTGLPACSS